jgi:hypothetical protein
MLGYVTARPEIAVRGGANPNTRSLLDRQRHADPPDLAEATGISSAQRPLFGPLWQAGQPLVEVLATLAGVDSTSVRSPIETPCRA